MNFKKFTYEAGKAVFLHCTRERGKDFQYGNQSIDPSRFNLNAKLNKTPKNEKGESLLFPSDYDNTVKSFLGFSQKKTGRKVAKNAKVVIGVVITLPKEYLPPQGTDLKEWLNHAIILLA